MLDIDYWETETALNQILKGEDCAPFLFNSLTTPKYSDPSELGIELMENKERLIGRPLIDGTIKYMENIGKEVSIENVNSQIRRLSLTILKWFMHKH
jgi:hypothetical protein